MENKDKGFKIFALICYSLGFICLMSLGYVWAFGLPSFSDVNAERSFCFNNGGMPIEPSRENYNTLLCIFSYDKNETTGAGRWMAVAPQKVVNEGFGFKVGDYCFSCWDDKDCASPYNDVLREKGLHC